MIDSIIEKAHSTTELLLRAVLTSDIEEAIKLQDDIIRLASELRDFVYIEESPLFNADKDW